jgi:hypothetical protein
LIDTFKYGVDDVPYVHGFMPQRASGRFDHALLIPGFALPE